MILEGKKMKQQEITMKKSRNKNFQNPKSAFLVLKLKIYEYPLALPELKPVQAGNDDLRR